MRVNPSGPVPCDLFLLGECPGWEEQQYGEGFVGKAGQELWAGFSRLGLPSRSHWYISNVVKGGQDKNKKPKPTEIAAALPELLDEIRRVQPKLIVAAGATAAGIFLDRGIADTHGIPHRVRVAGMDFVVLPTYHPAAGLHNKGYLPAFGYDLGRIGAFLRGDLPTWEVGPSLVASTWQGDPFPPGIVALDTEGYTHKPWGLTFSTDGQRGWVIRADEPKLLRRLNRTLQDYMVVLHNAMHDLPVLAAMGITVPAGYHDTMVLAYHDMLRTGSGILEAESQNLGTLAYRECGLTLGELSDCEGVDLEYETIPYNESVMQYAAADPCATWRLFDVYRRRGLVDSEAYQIDMSQMPLVARMMATGLPVNETAAREYLAEVTEKEYDAIDTLRQMAARRGHLDLNPRSHPQIRRLLTEQYHLRLRKRTKGGLASTNEKALSGHTDVPFVKVLQLQRELTKLRSTYLVPLLEALS